MVTWPWTEIYDEWSNKNDRQHTSDIVMGCITIKNTRLFGPSAQGQRNVGKSTTRTKGFSQIIKQMVRLQQHHSCYYHQFLFKTTFFSGIISCSARLPKSTCGINGPAMLTSTASSLWHIQWMIINLFLERCNPWPHVANCHISISQLLSV